MLNKTHDTPTIKSLQERRITIEQGIANQLKLEHSQIRIQRKRAARKENTSIIIGGVLAAFAVEALQQLGANFFGPNSTGLQGWSLKIIGVTLIAITAKTLINHLLWQFDDHDYEEEITKTSSK